MNDDILSKYKDPDAIGGNEQNISVDDLMSQYKDPDEVLAQQKAAEEGPGIVSSALTGFKRPFERMAEGGLQLGKEGLQAIGLMGEGEGVLEQVVAKRDTNLREAREAHPNVTTGAQIAGQIGAITVAAAVPAGGTKLAAQMGLGALSGAGFGALQYVNPGESRGFNIALGAAVGAVAPVAFAAGSKLMDHILAKRGAAKIIKAGLKAGDDVNPLASQKAAERLGTTLTPGEAARSAQLLGREARLTVSPDQQVKLSKTLLNRATTLKQKTDEVISSFVREGDDVAQANADALYTELRPKAIPQNTFDSLMKNPSIAARMETVSKATDTTIRDLPVNSVGKLDAVKRLMSDELYSKTSLVTKTAKNLSGDELSAIRSAQKQLVTVLDDMHPSYATARGISHRLIQKREYAETLSRIPLEKGNTAPTPKQIYSTLFGTQEKQVEFVRRVQDVGGNVQQAKDLIAVMGKLQNTTIGRVLGKASLEETGKFERQVQGVSAYVLDSVRSWWNSRTDAALLELATSGEWAKQLRAASNTMGTKAGDRRLMQLFSSIMRKETTSVVKEPPGGPQ